MLGRLNSTLRFAPDVTELRSIPLRFKPILRRLIWGGRRLGTVLHKPIGDESDFAESWELSDYHDQVSVVDSKVAWPACHVARPGPAHEEDELLGKALGPRDQFPLLVKFIDAHQNLSVQVHPNDETGRQACEATTARPRPGSSSTPCREA